MLKTKDISIRKGDFKLENINLNIDSGDYFVLLGKSGAGKTVLLEIIAGLLKADSGEIFLDSKNITKEKIQNRKIGIVFQDNTLFPHLSVRQNILFPLRNKKMQKKEKEFLLQKYANLMNINSLLDRRTTKLSGGEIQRVALARTLINEPDCLLLDEPLSSLDVQLKAELRTVLKDINKMGVTILHVTHDYHEAIFLSNKIAILHEGKIVQKGETKAVFRAPANDFVASFTGRKNFFTANFSTNEILINEKCTLKTASKPAFDSGKILISERKIKEISLQEKEDKINVFQAKIIAVFPLLEEYELILDLGGIILSMIIPEEIFEKDKHTEGNTISISIPKEAIESFA
jgi:ABC-type sugar transport system ATPase subunit